MDQRLNDPRLSRPSSGARRIQQMVLQLLGTDSGANRHRNRLATQGDPSLPGARRLDRAYVNHLVVVALGDQPDILPLAGSRVLTGEQAQLDESLSRSARIFEAIPSIELACSSRK